MRPATELHSAGRRTNCDLCHKVRRCIRIRREDSGHEYYLCAWCRDAWKAYGIKMSHIDREHPEVRL